MTSRLFTIDESIENKLSGANLSDDEEVVPPSFKDPMDSIDKLRTYFFCKRILKPAGVFSPKLSRILPQKVAVSPSPAWLKKFEPIVTQNPMTIRRFFIIVIEKYLRKE
ncbi:hypothetical protein AVEN_50657-1 [Araneus ventricosus]|uniref:Uncharacterized protein n=1 Tax=Araneus ventricosus TaxID=182803 RepID=A0A4Y2JJA7_ARAVE|nr:hypothetical protein AVEN_50657-1 [Araneus ventricosus]